MLERSANEISPAKLPHGFKIAVRDSESAAHFYEFI
jgi:hypothetical protein